MPLKVVLPLAAESPTTGCALHGKPALESLVAEAIARYLALRSAASRVRAGRAPARFLIPMAVSPGFGIWFATFVSLLLEPVAYLLLADLERVGGRVAGTAPRHAQ